MKPLDVVGHGDVKRALAQARAHAVLLSGPARVGRRPLARWFSRRLNCAQPAGIEPCGRCPSCLAWAAGSHPDHLEIGPRAETRSGKAARAKVIPISAVSGRHDREGEFETHVVEWLETGPRHRHKVVVLDGGESLNESAANALLKVVEEPPHGARFVFVAEDPSGVIPTIVSRSVTLRVAPLPPAEMERLALALEPDLDPELLALAAGRPGVLFEREAVRAALAAARTFVSALGGGVLDALTAADGLEKSFSRDASPEALAFLLRDHPPEARLEADRALGETLEALEGYASPGLAFGVLAMRWRAALGFTGPGRG